MNPQRSIDSVRRVLVVGSGTMGTQIAAVFALAAGAASARQSDRNQPMDLEGNHQVCALGDNGECTITGNVLITQGSMNVRAAKAVIQRAGGDPSRAILTGGVTLRQQLDDGTPLTATASAVDYNLKTETVVFTGNVQISQPRGTLNGERVVYNMKTGSVESGGQSGGRVKMRILPKSAQGGG